MNQQTENNNNHNEAIVAKLIETNEYLKDNTIMKSINDIWAFIASDKKELELVILESAKSEVDLSNQVSEYIISSGGKRIRPLVLLLLARAMGYKGGLQYKLAAAVEFIHTATLLHDDVVDESDMRRNKLTANNQFGNAAAVLVGDFLYTRAFQMISQDLEASKIMADATNELAMGEVMQLMNINNLEITEEDYFRTINLKTAVLFSAACKFSGVLAKKEELLENLSDYGKYLGNAFQIADDVLDYIGDIEKTGKNIGDDLAESKTKLPLIHSQNNPKNTKKDRLKQIIANGDKEAISEVIEIISSTNSIDYSLQEAYKNADKAKQSISKLDESEFKDILLLIPDLAVKRNS